MPNITAKKVVEDAAKIVHVWEENPTFRMGEVTKTEFENAVAAADAADKAVNTKRLELTRLMDTRDDAARIVSKLTVRARSAIKGVFGPDSVQYDQAGGTRESERKPATRTAKAKG